MKSFMEVKCPRCGADLDIETDREMIFCQYCGAKIILTDENTYTINKNITINKTVHTVDDAKITRAETERMVQIRQLELEKQKSDRKMTILVLKIVFSIILAFATIGLYAVESPFCLATPTAILLIWSSDIH